MVSTSIAESWRGSRRENGEVLQSLTHGARTSEIAERLAISERTVKAHLAQALTRSSASSRS